MIARKFNLLFFISQEFRKFKEFVGPSSVAVSNRYDPLSIDEVEEFGDVQSCDDADVGKEKWCDSRNACSDEISLGSYSDGYDLSNDVAVADADADEGSLMTLDSDMGIEVAESYDDDGENFSYVDEEDDAGATDVGRLDGANALERLGPMTDWRPVHSVRSAQVSSASENNNLSTFKQLSPKKKKRSDQAFASQGLPFNGIVTD